MGGIAWRGVILCQKGLKTVKNGKTTESHPSEHEEQVGFVNWFESKFPGVRIFAIPNGGHRAMTVAKQMKAEGVRAGVPDLHIPEWRLWIEMKRVKGGRLSDEQKDWIIYLENIGHTVIVGLGATDASRKVLEHIKNPRPKAREVCEEKMK
jgi:hypothetical protein